MKLKSLITSLNELAPQKLAMSWDNVGLQIGSTEKEVKKVLICLTVDSNIVDFAVSEKVDLIISHHPLIFKSLKRVCSDKPVERQVYQLIKNDVSLFVMHTNLDVVFPGVSGCLFNKLGGVMDDARILSVTYREKLYKLSCYVPEDSHKEVLSAMFAKGAGSIGNYDNCSFSYNGIGTFRGNENSNPYLGSPGEMEQVNEIKLETVVSEDCLEKVKSAMVSAHPYEEVAYDIFELMQKGKKYGLGVYGKLKKTQSVESLLDITGGQLKGCKQEKVIKKLAVCGGSGSDLIEKVYGTGCNCYVTGDVKYHDEVLAEELGISLIDMGHYSSEISVLYMIENYIQKLYDNEIEILIME